MRDPVICVQVVLQNKDGIPGLHTIVTAAHAAIQHPFAQILYVFDQVLLHQLRGLLQWIQVVAEPIHHRRNIFLEPEPIFACWLAPLLPRAFVGVGLVAEELLVAHGVVSGRIAAEDGVLVLVFFVLEVVLGWVGFILVGGVDVGVGLVSVGEALLLLRCYAGGPGFVLRLVVFGDR